VHTLHSSSARFFHVFLVGAAKVAGREMADSSLPRPVRHNSSQLLVRHVPVRSMGSIADDGREQRSGRCASVGNPIIEGRLSRDRQIKLFFVVALMDIQARCFRIVIFDS
jgi:hypothetical protein